VDLATTLLFRPL